jgi:hypothetical protein
MIELFLALLLTSYSYAELPEVMIVTETSGPFQVGDRIPFHFEGKSFSLPNEEIELIADKPLIDLGWGFEWKPLALVALQVGDIKLPPVKVRIKAKSLDIANTLEFSAKVEGDVPEKDKPNDLLPAKRNQQHSRPIAIPGKIEKNGSKRGDGWGKTKGESSKPGQY